MIANAFFAVNYAVEEIQVNYYWKDKNKIQYATPVQ